MSETYQNGITEGIGAALSAAFPDAVIYAESVAQGVEMPCFFIRCLSSSDAPLVYPRSVRKYLFTVQYLPADELNPARECADISDRLYRCLNYITVEGQLVRGTDLRHEFVDDTLSFFADYGVVVSRASTDDNAMSEVSRKISTK